MGRKSKPKRTLRLAGTDRTDRHGEEEDDLEFNPFIPEPPDHLSKDALIEWGRISNILFESGLLSKPDMAALAAYCDAFGMWCEASRQLNLEGLTITTSNLNVIQNPLVGIKNQSREHMRKFLVEFGMTPASRAKVPKPKAKGSQEEQDWEKLG